MDLESFLNPSRPPLTKGRSNLLYSQFIEQSFTCQAPAGWYAESSIFYQKNSKKRGGEKMKDCPSCKMTSVFGNYCSLCGAKLIEVKLPQCCSCREKVFPADKFCSSCGLSREDALARSPSFWETALSFLGL